jgi:hypothetical protein
MTKRARQKIFSVQNGEVVISNDSFKAGIIPKRCWSEVSVLIGNVAIIEERKNSSAIVIKSKFGVIVGHFIGDKPGFNGHFITLIEKHPDDRVSFYTRSFKDADDFRTVVSRVELDFNNAINTNAA